MKQKRRRFSRKTRIMLLKIFADAVIKFLGVALFFIGIGALGECPSDPKQIVQALGCFIFGICIIGYNSYLLDRTDRRQDKWQ